MGVFDFISLLFLAFFFFPQLRKQLAKYRRVLLLRKLEKERESRVITLVHRRTGFSFLGFLLSDHIDIEDSQEILKAVRSTPNGTPIDMIMHTPGGLVLASAQIARALAKHPSKVTVFVPHHALSGGTFISLAAQEIVMDENALLGRVDPQLFGFPAASIRTVVDKKPAKEIEDRTFILSDLSEKALKQTKQEVQDLLEQSGYGKKEIEKITTEMVSGKYTHDHPITYEEAKSLGLKVRTDIPEQVYKLMELYPKQERGTESVQYVPKPLEKEGVENVVTYR